MLNSIIFTELLEFCRVILTSTIRSENLYLPTTLLLTLHLELLEFCEHLSLKLDKCYPRHPCELIHKRQKIPISSKRRFWNWSAHIRVHYSKSMLCSLSNF